MCFPDSLWEFAALERRRKTEAVGKPRRIPPQEWGQGGVNEYRNLSQTDTGIYRIAINQDDAPVFVRE